MVVVPSGVHVFHAGGVREEGALLDPFGSGGDGRAHVAKRCLWYSRGTKTGRGTFFFQYLGMCTSLTPRTAFELEHAGYPL